MPRDWLTILYLYARPQVWEVYSVSSLIPLRLNVLRMGWGPCLGGGAQGTLGLHIASCVAAQQREALSVVFPASNPWRNPAWISIA